jgi:hypothetical protein
MMDMKLSDAIRGGAKRRPASESGWADVGPDGEVRTCALLAAAEEAGIFMVENGQMVMGPNGRPSGAKVDPREGGEPALSAKMPEDWNPVTMALELPPCACSQHGFLAEVIVIIWHLHDIHRWSREAVAEWIGTIEEKIEARLAHNQQVSEMLEKSACSAKDLVEKP